MVRVARGMAATVKFSLRYAIAGVLLMAPRAAISYLGYVFAPLLFIDWRVSLRQILFLAALTLFALLSLAVQVMQNQLISPTSAAIELALLFPFLLFLAGARPRGDMAHAVFLLRMLNVSLVIISAVRMIFFEGIPNFSPDDWNGLFGLGGAKILTIVGFFGIALELLLREHGRRISRFALIAAIVNFLVPSYMIGIAVGMLALALAFAGSFREALRSSSPRSLRFTVLITIIVGFVLAVPIVDRLGSVDSTAVNKLGVHPKAFTHLASLEALADGQVLGLGVGQFTSTPQTWLDPGLSAKATHRAPELPLFHMSDAYADRITDYTRIGSKKQWTFSSSLNQPVAGWAALLGEWGLGILLIFGALWRRLAGTLRSPPLRATAIFLVVINLIDSWVDSPWFGVVLILLYGVAKSLRERGADTDRQRLDQGGPAPQA